MTESAWKVVMDRDGLTISGDRFSLTTSGADPGSLDAVMSELQAVTRGTLGQYCGLARAVEAVGERWGMLIVRDLLVGAKSAAELCHGLPRMPRNLLAMRLREMTYCGVVEQDETTDGGEHRYRLTEYGRGLEDVLLAFGRWGAAMLAKPRPEDIVTEDSMITAMRATFQPAAAQGRSARFELHFGDVIIHVVVEDGRLEAGRGPLTGAPVIDPGPALKDLLTRTLSVREALATGTVVGDPAALDSFVSLFALPQPSAVG